MSSYNHIHDNELYALLTTGDLKAFTAIHKRYYGVLYIHAYRKYPYREEIKDILQEIFSDLWNNREYINVHGGIKVYLYTAVRNRILNVYKHEKVRSHYNESLKKFAETAKPNPDEILILKELIRLVDAEVSALPPQMRKVFEMSRKSNLSHKEIAEELNISPLTVKKHVNNSLKILRVKLGPHFFILFL